MELSLAGVLRHPQQSNWGKAQAVSCKTAKWMHLSPIMAQNKNFPDLTQRPPRSPRVRLGGFVLLPRILDKGRAQLAGKNGEYNYACPMDQHFLQFVGIDPKALQKQLATGKGDGEILAWVLKHAKHQRTPAEIHAWSAYQEQRAPGDVDGREFLHGAHAKIAPKREDIATWFDLLDLDDYVTFGGAA